jgi:carbon storage regulator
VLVIRRRAGESIVIDGNIEIEVLETSPTRVKLGVRAPKEVEVLRKEVGFIAGENLSAAREVPFDVLTPLLAQLGHAPALSDATPGDSKHDRR